jgi:hypothetical protein
MRSARGIGALIKTDQLLQDLDEAKVHLQAARSRLNAIHQQSPEYQGALISYLHAVVSHMSIVSVAQAKQHQDLSEEVDRLATEVTALHAQFNAFARPRLSRWHLGDRQRETMRRARPPELTPSEEITLRRIGYGIAKPTDLSTSDVERLVSVRVASKQGNSLFATPLGERVLAGLPIRNLLTELLKDDKHVAAVAKALGVKL